MSGHFPWAFPYQLPYSVLCPNVRALFSVQSDVSVQLCLRDGRQIDDDVIGDAGSLLVVFFEMALSGALAGGQIQPWMSSIENYEEDVLKDSIIWMLQKCLIDESCMVMLAQSFLLVHESFPIEKLVFSPARQTCGYYKLIINDQSDVVYPEAYKPLDFSLLKNNGVSSSPEITIEFEKPLSDEEKENIDIEISTWLAAGEVGIYAVHPLSPADCTFTSNDDLFFYEAMLEFSLSKFKAHPNALNGLINICSAMNRRIAKIKRLVID